MKKIIFTVALAIAFVLIYAVGVVGIKMYFGQKELPQISITNDETPLVYDQGVIEASGYCKLKNQVIPIKSADIFLNEEFVQIVMDPEDPDMQPLMFTTQSSKWASNIFRDSFTTVVVTDKTVVLKSELNEGTLISLKR
jgi:hypothetical protein